MVAVAPYPDAVGWVAVPGPYPDDGCGCCLGFVALSVARYLSDVYTNGMGTNTETQAPIQSADATGAWAQHLAAVSAREVNEWVEPQGVARRISAGLNSLAGSTDYHVGVTAEAIDVITAPHAGFSDQDAVIRVVQWGGTGRFTRAVGHFVAHCSNSGTYSFSAEYVGVPWAPDLFEEEEPSFDQARLVLPGGFIETGIREDGEAYRYAYAGWDAADSSVWAARVFKDAFGRGGLTAMFDEDKPVLRFGRGMVEDCGAALAPIAHMDYLAPLAVAQKPTAAEVTVAARLEALASENGLTVGDLWAAATAVMWDWDGNAQSDDWLDKDGRRPHDVAKILRTEVFAALVRAEEDRRPAMFATVDSFTDYATCSSLEEWARA